MLVPILMLLLTDLGGQRFLVPSRTDHPPVTDGALVEQVWTAAAASGEFSQLIPVDGARPSERTTVRALYDEEALYFGIDCEQVQSPIQERLTRRDEDSESDWVFVYLDSRDDGKSAFLFGVNVSGVLRDGQITDQTMISFDWDENWEARTARTATGWSAEIRIPFRLLRFDSHRDTQSWGLQFGRYIAAVQETDFWKYIPRSVSNPVASYGRLEGIGRTERRTSVELQPFALIQGSRRDSTTQSLGSGYGVAWSAGLDLRAHVSQDLTVDAAVNPDFAQVDADQVVLNLTNYELLLPEKRRLFLEGTEVFRFPLQMFYSRRIGSSPAGPVLPTDAPFTRYAVDAPGASRIYGAAKLVGRVGPSWSVGLLSAVTGPNSEIVQDGAGARSQVTAAPATLFNVFRLRRNLGGLGHLGVLGTGATTFERGDRFSSQADPAAAPGSPPAQLCPGGEVVANGARCFHDAYVGGADLLIRSPGGDYVGEAAIMESYLRGGPVRTAPDGTKIGPGAYAPGGSLRVAKDGGAPLVWSASYVRAGLFLDYNDLGFMPRQNVQQLDAVLGLRRLRPWFHTLEMSAQLEVSSSTTLTGLDLGRLYELSARVRFSGFWTLSGALDVAPARFDDREIGDGAALERAAYVGGKLTIASDPSRRVQARATGQAQRIGDGADAGLSQADLFLHAMPRLELSLTVSATWAQGEMRYAALASTAAQYVFGRLDARSASATVRASYTFTTALTLQLYLQTFLASGHYTDLRALPGGPAPNGRGTLIRLSDALAAAPATPGTAPDFEQAALNANVVLRWEYRLGCTAFLVYTRSQLPTLATTDFQVPASLELRALGRRQSADVILFKLSYWWAN